MSSFEVKDGNKATIKVLLTALISIDRTVIGERWTPDHFLLDLPLKWELSSVFLEDSELKGFLIASLKSDSVHIHRLAVAPEDRGKGLGRTLIAELMKKTGRIGASKITLKVACANENAIEFYRAFGFRTVGEDEKNLHMEMNL